jgi:chromate transporter
MPATTDLATVLREWGRIGCIGFGGPPAHIALLRQLCVEDRRWLDPQEFEDAIAACNLLPGPASTQLAIFCAWRVRGRVGALVGGAAFILPGLVVILALAVLFLAGSPPTWVKALGAGAGSAVAAVAVQAGINLMPAGWARATAHGSRARWVAYLVVGAAAAALLGPWLVVVLIVAGLLEVTVQRRHRPAPALPVLTAGTLGGGTLLAVAWVAVKVGLLEVTVQRRHRPAPALPVLTAGTLGGGTLLAVAWVAVKVGLLSYGGGFVIIPLMQADAVGRYHWMTAAQFLNAVALGQITPGPVVQTVAVVGYAAAGIGGGVLASVVAFTPSFLFILLGADRFDRLRADQRVRAFLDGAGPAAIGAIIGSAVPLALALARPWQYAVLAGAAILLLAFRRGVVLTLLAAAAAGLVLTLAGAPLPQ